MHSNKYKPLLFSVAVLALSSCKSATSSGRNDLANNVADQGQFIRKEIDASPFRLTTFQKISQVNAPTTRIYIEGDGLAWLSKTQASLNPTPTDPFALKLAAKDSAPNVIYMARPCQYSGRIDGGLCDSRYWRSARYAPEVINSYNAALNQIKAQYNLQGFELIGYSGGGTLAALLAASRSDVKTLRTIAGNLDHKEHSRVHNVSPLSASLNPPDYAARLSAIPQVHFIGSDDAVVPPSIYQSYARAFQNQSCLNYKIISGKDHDSDNWHQDWPALLGYTPRCQTHF